MEYLNEKKLSLQIEIVNELIIISSTNYIQYLKKMFNVFLDRRRLNYITKQSEESFIVSFKYLTNEHQIILTEKYKYNNIVNMLLGLQTLAAPLFDFGNTNHCRLLNNLFENLQEKNRINAIFHIEKIEILFSIQKIYSTAINAKSKLEEWTNKVEEFVDL